jgi:hypothetical protein
MTTKTQTFDLTIEKIEVRTRKPFGIRPRWQTGEIDELYLHVTAYSAELDQTVYFDTPAIEQHIVSGPGMAVVTFSNKSFAEKENDWLTIPESYCVGANDSTPRDYPRPTIVPHQAIKVQARVKKQTPTYVVLNYVKLVK